MRLSLPSHYCKALSLLAPKHTVTSWSPIGSSKSSSASDKLRSPSLTVIWVQQERKLLQAVNQLGDANEVLSECAEMVMARMSHKLMGHDFSSPPISSSSNQHSMDDSNLFSEDSREVNHKLSVKLQVPNY